MYQIYFKILSENFRSQHHTSKNKTKISWIKAPKFSDKNLSNYILWHLYAEAKQNTTHFGGERNCKWRSTLMGIQHACLLQQLDGAILATYYGRDRLKTLSLRDLTSWLAPKSYCQLPTLRMADTDYLFFAFQLHCICRRHWVKAGISWNAYAFGECWQGLKFS